MIVGNAMGLFWSVICDCDGKTLWVLVSDFEGVLVEGGIQS